MTDRVVREMAARPDVVWAALSDITRLGEWSTECYRCDWNSDQAPGVGSTFTGYNRLGDKEWSNEATVTAWVPEQRLEWDVRMIGASRERFGDKPFSRWGFSIEPTDAGTRVTQTTEDLRTEEIKQRSLDFLPEIPDRRERNLETMAGTLDALARACE
ncbi:MAG: hypothetical protein ACI8TP_001695 [Acidimicrobiales bacterium]|jgi:uncharacterized protein YndB with AHSA1/START domain